MSQRILIVDDDPEFLGQLGETLSSAGYEVVPARSGNEAVRALERLRKDIDMVMLDLSLPQVSGFELIGMLTRRPNPIKIIAFSGVYGPLYLEIARNLGAHAAIRKPPQGSPLPKAEWLAVVRRTLGDESAANSA